MSANQFTIAMIPHTSSSYRVTVTVTVTGAVIVTITPTTEDANNYTMEAEWWSRPYRG